MKQILIVEDDSFLNKMLDYNLTADGYGVTSALNARTAADAIRQREFDLLLHPAIQRFLCLRQTGAGGRYFGSHFRWASCAGANGGGVEPVVGGTAP